jgi:hypothetical protein
VFRSVGSSAVLEDYGVYVETVPLPLRSCARRQQVRTSSRLGGAAARICLKLTTLRWSYSQSWQLSFGRRLDNAHMSVHAGFRTPIVELNVGSGTT